MSEQLHPAKCPKCGDQLFQSKDKLVCINCGYSRGINDEPPPKPVAHKAAVPSKTVAPVAPKPKPEPKPAPAANSHPSAKARPEPPAMVEPPRDEALIAERKLAGVVGDKRVEAAKAEISALAESSKTFAQTYRDDLNAVLPGGIKRTAIAAGILIVGLAVLLLYFTVHIIPGH